MKTLMLRGIKRKTNEMGQFHNSTIDLKYKGLKKRIKCNLANCGNLPNNSDFSMSTVTSTAPRKSTVLRKSETFLETTGSDPQSRKTTLQIER